MGHIRLIVVLGIFFISFGCGTAGKNFNSSKVENIALDISQAHLTAKANNDQKGIFMSVIFTLEEFSCRFFWFVSISIFSFSALLDWG